MDIWSQCSILSILCLSSKDIKKIESMKKYIYIIIIALVSLTSCHDLNPKVFDKISPENFPSNEEDIKSMVTGVYGELNRGAYSGFGDIAQQSRMIMNTATTDEFKCSWRNGTWMMYEDFTWKSTNGEVTAKTYTQYAQVISKAIVAIDAINRYDVGLSQELKSRYVAELETIIALHLYYMYDFYGALAIVLDPKIINDGASVYIAERQSKEESIKIIREYARRASDNLPTKYEIASDYGRMTKGVGLMILTKLAMHEKEWDVALKHIKEIEDLNYYELQNSYLSIFSVENEGNKEVILPIVNAADNNRYNNWLAHVLPDSYKDPNDLLITSWNGYKMTWSHYDKYWDFVGTPGAPINDERVTKAIIEKYHKTNGDFVDIRALRDAAIASGENSTEWYMHGVVPYKYPADPAGNGEKQGNDYVIFRYADVLLYKAEAIHNLRPMDSEAIDLVNRIRTRAKTTTIKAADFANAQAFGDFILAERGRELFMEGTRREDLIRNGKYLEVAKQRYRDTYNAEATWIDDTKLLFPIPQSVIDQAKGIIKQNPGY